VAEVVRDAKKTLSIKTMWKKHPEKHHADKGLLDTSETAPGKSSSTTSNVAQEGATVNNMDSAIKKDSLPTNTSNDVHQFGKLSSNSPSVAELPKNVNKDRKYSVREERSEVEKAAENYVAPEDLLQKARDIVPIYTGAKVNKQMPAYKRYNNKARGGLISAPNASELASVVAMHVHNVLRIKGANVELTRSVLQEAENADPYLRLFDKNGKDIGLTPAQALQEGVSIFGRYYFTDPELARERFPEYHKKFQAALNSDETLKNKVEAFQSAVEQLQMQDVLLRARGGFVRKNMTPRTFRDRVVDGLRDFYGHWVDDTDPRLSKKPKSKTGRKWLSIWTLKNRL
jgi:hypothetical protein